MRRKRRRRCVCCGELFREEPRSRGRQRFCSRAECRAASKAASQRRWLNKPENQGYFSGASNLERVRAWRATCNDKLKKSARTKRVLQDPSSAVVTDLTRESRRVAIQDICRAQPAILVGLIAEVTGSRTQDAMLSAVRRLIQLGQDILDDRLSGAPELQF